LFAHFANNGVEGPAVALAFAVAFTILPPPKTRHSERSEEPPYFAFAFALALPLLSLSHPAPKLVTLSTAGSDRCPQIPAKQAPPQLAQMHIRAPNKSYFAEFKALKSVYSFACSK
jgi:hypothetical protein